MQDLATPLARAIRVQLGETSQAAYERLQSADCDQAPVYRGPKVVGYVRRAQLPNHAKIKGTMVGLADCHVVSDSCPIATGVQMLGDQSLVFVAGPDGLSGFVTPSDLDRHAARADLYVLLTRIEIALSAICRVHCRPETVISQLKPHNRQAFEGARCESMDSDPVEYLDLGDLIELALQLPSLSARIPAEVQNSLREACKIRPAVMHATRSLAASMETANLAALWRKAKDLADNLEAMQGDFKEPILAVEG